MNEQNNIQEPDKKKSSTVKLVVVTIVITTLVVGGSVYLWQKSVQKNLIERYDSTKIKSQQQNEQLKSQMTEQKTEQKQDTSTLIVSNWKTYTEPNEYSIQYPSNWYLRGGGRKMGDEILQLWNYDSEKTTVSNGSGLPPNPAKVALSIRAKNSKTLEEVIFQEHCKNVQGPYEVGGPYQIEKLTINGQQAVGLSYFCEGDTSITVFISYKDNKYATITARPGGSHPDFLVKEIKKIYESFKIIQ